jgi:hypothetical protein
MTGILCPSLLGEIVERCEYGEWVELAQDCVQGRIFFNNLQVVLPGIKQIFKYTNITHSFHGAESMRR